ncbi:hypothetical protein PanWU01x14_193430, partial [Parasponia andersonii]
YFRSSQGSWDVSNGQKALRLSEVWVGSGQRQTNHPRDSSKASGSSSNIFVRMWRWDRWVTLVGMCSGNHFGNKSLALKFSQRYH